MGAVAPCFLGLCDNGIELLFLFCVLCPLWNNCCLIYELLVPPAQCFCRVCAKHSVFDAIPHLLSYSEVFLFSPPFFVNLVGFLRAIVLFCSVFVLFWLLTFVM